MHAGLDPVHQLDVPGHADRGGLPDQRELGVALPGPEQIESRRGVLHRDIRVAGGERPEKLPAPGERVGRGEVGVFNVTEAVDGQAGGGERVGHGGEVAGGPRGEAELPSDRRGVGLLAVIERAARCAPGDVEGARPAAPAHHHHQRRIGELVAGQVPERGKLVERPEIGDRRPPAERDEHSISDPARERIAPGGVFA